MFYRSSRKIVLSISDLHSPPKFPACLNMMSGFIIWAVSCENVSSGKYSEGPDQTALIESLDIIE